MATSSRPPDTAASAARCATFETFDVSWLWMLVAAVDGVARPDQPPDPPAGHGVGLGHAVGHQAALGQLGHQHRHGVVLGAAVDQVLVDLVGDHPDPLGRRPSGRWPRSPRAGTPPRSGWTGTRRGAPWCWGSRPPRGPRPRTRKPVVSSEDTTTGVPPARAMDSG